MGWYSNESSEKRLGDGKVGLTYRMDNNQMSVDRPWEIFLFFYICFGGELLAALKE